MSGVRSDLKRQPETVRFGCGGRRGGTATPSRSAPSARVREFKKGQYCANAASSNFKASKLLAIGGSGSTAASPPLWVTVVWALKGYHCLGG